MGLRYDSGESQQMISHLQQTIEDSLSFIQQADTGINQLVASIGSDGITGKAYEKGKQLFNGPIKKEVNELKRANDKLKSDLTRYKSADQKVRKYGRIDEDKLEATKSQIQKQMHNLESMQADYRRKSKKTHDSDLSANYRHNASKIQWQIDGQAEGLNAIEKELAELRSYNQQVSGLFETKINEIIKIQSNVAITGLSKALFKNKRKTDKKIIIKNFEKAYGLDSETAKDLYEFNQKFDKYAVKMKWSRKETAHQYVRYLASLSGFYSGFEWRLVAGNLPPNVAKHELKKMGFSESFLNRFSRLLIDNHQDKNLEAKNDFVHITGSMSVILNTNKTQKNLMGLVSSGDFGILVRNFIRMNVIAPFKIFSPTLGAQIAEISLTAPSAGEEDRVLFNPTSLSNKVNSEEAATYRGDIASGTKGISPNDMKADTDALNISHLIEHGESVQDAFVSYSNQISNHNNRIIILEKNLGYGNSEKGEKIFKDRVFSPIVDLGDNGISLKTIYDQEKEIDEENKKANANNQKTIFTPKTIKQFQNAANDYWYFSMKEKAAGND